MTAIARSGTVQVEVPLRLLVLTAVALSASGSAWAVDPDRLRVGTVPALRECLNGDDAACDLTATRVEDRGWAAWLRKQDATGLDEDDRRTFLALDCASDDEDSCAALADDVLTDDPLRATMLYARACSLGATGACQTIDVPSLFSPDAAYHLLSGGASWGSEKPGYARPTDAAEAIRFGKACAADTWPGACLDLGGSVWRALGARDTIESDVDALDEACQSHVEPACKLTEDVAPDDRPVIGGIGPTFMLLDRVCRAYEIGRACELSGNLLELGRASPFGTSASRERQQLACNHDRPGGCQRITRAYRSPRGTELQQECDSVRAGQGGAPHACAEAGAMLLYGVGIAKDEALAEQRMRDACDAGDAGTCAIVGDKFDDSKRMEAFPWWEKACTAGAWTYCGGAMAWRLEGTNGAPVDPTRAVRDVTAGCAHGAANACSQLALAKEDGLGTSEDRAGTYALYLEACSLGSNFGCGGLGWALAEGYGTSSDPSSALPLLLYACHAGDSSTCDYLGQIYKQGGPVAVDLPRARGAFKAACDAGMKASCTSLDEIGHDPITPLATMELPSLRGGGLYGGGSTDYGPPLHRFVAEVTPVVRNHPTPRVHSTGGGAAPDGLSAWLALGSQRSWTLRDQAASVRVGLGYTTGLVGVGGTFDWVSDNRWKPKVARQYFRVALNADVWLRVPTSSVLDVLIGAGGGVGGYRPGPGKTNALTLSENTHEFLQFNVHAKGLLFGVRLEQAQWFQKLDGLELDHVTGIYGLIGVTGGR